MCAAGAEHAAHVRGEVLIDVTLPRASSGGKDIQAEGLAPGTYTLEAWSPSSAHSG
jgi:hypothetical protein